MKHTITIQHDGYSFYVSPMALKSGNELIGFYFDNLGYPQRILSQSVYGSVIKMSLKEEGIYG